VKNRQLLISGVFLSDVAEVLKEKGIPLTEVNIMACAVKVQIDAHAIAMATLQELDHETWLEEIELFKGSSRAHITGQPVKSGTYLGQGERLRHIQKSIKRNSESITSISPLKRQVSLRRTLKRMAA
jgi:hypothetical protein